MVTNKVQISVKVPIVKKKSATEQSTTDTDTNSNYSYMGKTIEDTYQNKELQEHILSDPDTYAGSIDPQEEEVWHYDEEAGRMFKDKLVFRECFYKLFDETLVNAIDQHHRLANKIKDDPSLKQVSKISVVLNEDIGEISVENNGEGLDVIMHKTFGMYVPQVLFGKLLTSINYDNTEERTVGGKNGYGSKITNIYSTKYTLVTVDSRRQLKYTQTWRDNMTVVEEPIIEKYTGVPYTKITYLPDYKRFDIENPLVIDDWKLLRKRVYDASACTGPNTSIYLNNKKIKIKGFEDYINLYIGRKSVTKRVFAEINERWQVGVCLSPEGDFEQVSFVNGICTDRGGRHISHIMDNLSKKIIESISESAKKKGVIIRAEFIKRNLFLFLKATIVNPKFDTQTKRKLVSLVKDFGSRCVLDQEFITKVIKLGILDRAQKLAEFKAKENLGKKTDGKPRAKRVCHENLVDATDAGGKDSNKCTIVFTEGDSASCFMARGIKGIPDKEHSRWGWFALRGKLLNVRMATIKQLSNNEEIMMIKKIIGLEEGKDYSKSIDGLRYHRIMILTDADNDGFHIKGLVMNYIGQYWPALLKHEGFVCDFATPIKKAFKSNTRGKKLSEVEFYSEEAYDTWNVDKKGWTIQYYKGLGSYEPSETRKLCNTMSITEYVWDNTEMEFKGKKADSSEHKFDLAFGNAKNFADERKLWLNNGIKPLPIDPIIGEKTLVTYDSFIDNRLKLFSYADNVRSIPCIYDGLKPSQRKVLYSCFKRNLKDRIKVSQLAGYVSEHGAYHHGEASLVGTIVHMAQDYVGSNNINMLYPSGGFGSRMGGGPDLKKGHDAAAPRYALTFLTAITRTIFNEHDLPLLNYKVDEGMIIEPDYYMPIIPLILINGTEGIGTGYSTTVHPHNPLDVIDNTKACMRGETMTEMIPWIKGYNGKIIKTGHNTYITLGYYTRVGANKIRILEPPVGAKNCKSFKAYVAFLNTLLDEESAKQYGIKKAKNNDDNSTVKSSTFKGAVIHHYDIIKETDTDLVIDIEFKEGVLDKELADNKDYRFEKKLKLAFSFSSKNMHLYIDDGTIKKFNDTRDIITEFCRVRKKYYVNRRLMLLKKYGLTMSKSSSKYRFVVEVMDRTLDISRKKRTVVEKMLKESTPPYPMLVHKIEDNDDKAGYQYLLGMQIGSFTEEILDKLKNELAVATEATKRLENMDECDLWTEDLNNLLNEYNIDLADWYDRNDMTIRVPRKKVAITKTPKTKTVVTLKPPQKPISISIKQKSDNV